LSTVPNREQRRTERRQRRAVRSNSNRRIPKQQTSSSAEKAKFLSYRAFRALGNYPKIETLAGSEFEYLDELMALIEQALRVAHDPNPEHWFPNNIAALTLLARAYQGLQAAANLCAMGFYVEATGLVRTVYESAGLARALAHRPERAEEWVFAESWVRDKFSRDFARTMTSAEFTKEINEWAGADEDSFAHDSFYDFVSKYSHPLAKSTLQFLFDPNDAGQPGLYPAVEEKWFRDCANLITIQAIFVAYALRNAAADPAALPATWHQQLAAVARKVSGLPLAHVEIDWKAHEERHQAIRDEMRHTDELDSALDADPASLRNAIRRLASKSGTNS
jgi:hypothetical protein